VFAYILTEALYFKLNTIYVYFLFVLRLYNFMIEKMFKIINKY